MVCFTDASYCAGDMFPWPLVELPRSQEIFDDALTIGYSGRQSILTLVPVMAMMSLALNLLNNDDSSASSGFSGTLNWSGWQGP